MNQEKIRELFPSKCSALSGFAYSVGIFPHLIFLVSLYFMNMKISVGFSFIGYFGALALGEYLFWSWFKNRLKLAHSPFVIRLKEFNRKELNTYLLAATSEIIFDAMIVFKSVGAGWDILSVWILLLSLKFFMAPIQSLLSQCFLSDNIAYAIVLIPQVVCIPLVEEGSNLLLCALLIKGVICNAIAVARSQLANNEVLNKVLYSSRQS